MAEIRAENQAESKGVKREEPTAGLGREQILAAADRIVKRVPVREWGGAVYVRSLSSAERDDWELKWANWRKNRSYPDGDFRLFNAFLAVFVLCDAEGKTLFTPNDTEALAAKSARGLEAVSRMAQRLNGISATDLEELVKNCESGPSTGRG